VKAEQLLRSAEAYERGAVGEETTARALGELSAEGWRVFHDVRWPGRSQANIDHVLVGPSGVFVIDSKAWDGAVEVRGGALRQDGRRRHRHVVAAAAAAMAVGDLVPGLHHKAIHPVICFAREESIFGWCADVMVCSTQNVVTFLTSRPRVLDEAQMTEVAETLATSLHAAPAKVPAVRAVYAGEETPEVAPARVPRREARLPRAPLPAPVKRLLRLAAVVAVVLLALRFDVPGKVGDAAADAMQRVVAPTERIGTPVSVPAMGSRPDLEVTVGAPRATRSTVPGVRPLPGHQLVAVPVSVRNTGDQAWRSMSDLNAAVTDTTGASYSNDPGFTSVTAGQSLRSTIKLPAQERLDGFIVFEVPRGTEVAKIRLRVGPELPKTLRWSVD
jgi:hypothetical protein